MYDSIVAKQLYRTLIFHNIFIYCRNLIYLTYGKIWLNSYVQDFPIYLTNTACGCEKQAKGGHVWVGLQLTIILIID